ncbi:LOW QUALITY PROTEIN: protein cornichon homolog 3-like [Lampetra planeri]
MVFSFVAFCYMLSLVLCSALLFFAVWRIAAYDELWRESNAASDQTDCITKLERERKIEKLCRMLMKLALPEYFIHCLFCVMFLCALEWLALAVNLPLFCYHSWRFMQSPGKQSAADATHDPGTATQAEVLAYCRREGWCKLGFYLLSYFYYLYKCSGVLPRGLTLINGIDQNTTKHNQYSLTRACYRDQHHP